MPLSIDTKDNGVRPFQKATMDAFDSKVQIIVVDAHVGAGKGHIVRQAFQRTMHLQSLYYSSDALIEFVNKSRKIEIIKYS